MSVRQHFQDIGQDETVQDVTYENSQARERTQILMDVANKEGGAIVPSAFGGSNSGLTGVLIISSITVFIPAKPFSSI